MPFRAVDTRRLGDAGRIGNGMSDDWSLLADADGVVRLPSTAAAVTFNLTVAGTRGFGGYLTVTPARVFSPVSTINWIGDDRTLANGGVIALAASPSAGVGSLTVSCGASADSSTHYVLDITGYYVVGT